ncbi:MAG: DUF4412 domain-containing protein [Burkholderiales bacterium]|nr:DUF4412 domain-containing protein [Opitutaceae bacterium]
MTFPKSLRRFAFGLVATLTVAVAHAADFEGTLKWSFKAEVTDPAMKQQMADAQAQLADPAKLAQMKAMLENPQMLAMMEQNPQMKSAIEAQIKLAEDAAAGKGGDMMSAMMPTGMTLKTKAGRTHMQLEGGMMPTEVIGRTQPPEATMIDRKARTFSRVPTDPAATSADKAAHKVTKTAATAKILGYTCEQYLVETTQSGKPMNGVFWATDDIPGLDAASLSQARLGGGGADTFMNEIKGIPLRMEMSMPQMKIQVEAVAVREGVVPDSVFEIPAGFVEKPLAGAAAAAFEGVKK